MYEIEHFGVSKYWRARLPGRTDIIGRGVTKPMALNELKAAQARGNVQTERRR